MERKPLEEMLGAEKAGTFRYSDKSDVSRKLELDEPSEVASSTQALTDRLDDLKIESSAKSSTGGSLASGKSEKPAKALSTSRPLAVDDDLDDLDLDENIDTTVSN